VRQKELIKTHTSNEAQKSRERLIPQVRDEKWRKTHTSGEAQKVEKNSYLK
jgi:phosphoribosyl-AMP cyclohydrolase